jgi:hypothetical protein
MTSRLLRIVFGVLGTLAAAYLWAAVFGRGIHGLKDTTAANDASSLPSANVALVAAIACFAVAPFASAWYAGAGRPLPLYAFCAIAGGLIFAVLTVV